MLLECARTAKCAPLKHHFEECAERVTAQQEDTDHKGPKEDCVEECEFFLVLLPYFYLSAIPLQLRFSFSLWEKQSLGGTLKSGTEGKITLFASPLPSQSLFTLPLRPIRFHQSFDKEIRKEKLTALLSLLHSLPPLALRRPMRRP